MNEYNNFAVMSYSFHGLIKIGAMDIFGYLETVRYRYGLATADIWNGLLKSYDEEYLQMVKNAVPLPILRKDFIIDPYQVYQAKAAGADAILLIAEILSDSELAELQMLAAELQMTTLIEVHEMESLPRVLAPGSAGGSNVLLGINNRDLRTFSVDLSTTLRLAELIVDKRILVSESGIKDRSDVERLVSVGVRSLLIGETLMRSGDIPRTMAELKNKRFKE